MIPEKFFDFSIFSAVYVMRLNLKHLGFSHHHQPGTTLLTVLTCTVMLLDYECDERILSSRSLLEWEVGQGFLLHP